MPRARELLVLPVRNKTDKVSIVIVARIGEALSQATPGTRPGHDELHLGEGQDVRVIEISDQLVRKKGADASIPEKFLISSLH